jgi:hypothetical protein
MRLVKFRTLHMPLCTLAIFSNITHHIQFQGPALHDASVTRECSRFFMATAAGVKEWRNMTVSEWH